MARSQARKCILESCDRDATDGELCHRDFVRINGQLKRGVAWILARHRTVNRWMEGLELATGRLRREKITPITAGKRKSKPATKKRAVG